MHDFIRSGQTFPWGDLERLIERVVISLGRSGDLFWVANNPAAPPDVDYLAFHQARVAVLSMRIGADVGYEPGIRGDRLRQPFLDVVEVGIEPWRRLYNLERGHGFTAK